MKLLKKVSIYFIISSAVVFLVASVISYFVIREIIYNEVNESLVADKSLILKKMNSEKDFTWKWQSDYLSITKTGRNTISESICDTLLYVDEEAEFIPFRQLIFTKIVNGQNYKIILRRSLLEQEDLILGITAVMMLLLVTIFLLLNLINYLGDRSLWRPFYKTMEILQNIDIKGSSSTNFPDTDIFEFSLLNDTLHTMTEKLQYDFRLMKEFSENASHEMQTPLAIIRSKLDMMVQDETLEETQYESIRSLYNSVNRLSRLNQSLNLLTKIDNEEFRLIEEVNLTELIQRQLENLDELLKMHSLTVETDFNIVLVVKINSFMAETLISNLLINAIKHNSDAGVIKVITGNKFLKIENSGKPLHLEPKTLFERFKKEKSSTDSPGLGLAIVKSICDRYNADIQYVNPGNRHVITLNFK